MKNDKRLFILKIKLIKELFIQEMKGFFYLKENIF
jgi:hypothetical protein